MRFNPRLGLVSPSNCVLDTHVTFSRRDALMPSLLFNLYLVRILYVNFRDIYRPWFI